MGSGVPDFYIVKQGVLQNGIILTPASESYYTTTENVLLFKTRSSYTTYLSTAAIDMSKYKYLVVAAGRNSSSSSRYFQVGVANSGGTFSGAKYNGFPYGTGYTTETKVIDISSLSYLATAYFGVSHRYGGYIMDAYLTNKPPV